MAAENPTRLVITAIASAAGLFLAWQAADTLLLIAAGILFAVLLDALARPVQLSGLPRGLSLALVCLALAAAAIATIVWGSYTLVQQWDELARTLQEQLQKLGQMLDNLGVRDRAPDAARPDDGRSLTQLLLPDLGRVWGGARSAFSAAFGMIGSAIVIVLIGIFAAADPEMYRRGILAFVPANRRDRVADVLDEMAEMLRWWLIGQLVTMAIVGVTLGIVLTLLGMPGALLLALQAAVLNFIPYLGPFLAAIPIFLTALPLGLSMILWVMGAYLVIQILEGYLLTPIIQKRAVDLPPVLTLASLMLFGALFGGPGIAMATPILAAVRVAVLRLYVDETNARPKRAA
jgi:predicted PurR-regulated permease PerM